MNIPPANIPIAAPLDSAEEWRIQCVAYLAGELPPDEIGALSAALRALPELRGVFVELAKQQVLLGEIGEMERAELPAEISAALPRIVPAARTSKRTQSLYRHRGFQAAAALIMFGLLAGGIAYNYSRPRDAATSGGTDVALNQNVTMPDGQQAMESGLAQLQLENGVKLVIEGPAQYRIESPLKVQLEKGKLTAVVPANARGFTVQTPTARVIDLGTEFGVDTHPDGSTYAAVFSGTVRVSALESDTPLDTETTLTKGLAVNVFADSAAVMPGEFMPEIFVRDITQARSPIPLFDTGIDLKMGDADPHWQIVKEDFDPKFVPQQACVVKLRNTKRHDPSVAQWIALRGVPKTDPPGKYTFKATFDLSGFDPATALIQARVAADDALADILINGNSTGRSLSVAPNARTPEGSFILRGAFHAGVNEVEFVVENRAGLPSPNPVKLKVIWTGTAAKSSGQR